MRKAAGLVGLLLSAVWACGPPSGGEAPPTAADVWREGPALPQPLTNNAVAAVETDGGVAVFTFLGLDSTRAWSGVTNAAYRWDVETSSGWRRVAPVPGPGRLAATAQTVGGRIYVFGGYTVDEDGTERSVPDVNVFDPRTDTWSRGADIPLPVDDAVSGVWRDSLVVLVSGWHDDDNVAAVQWYDAAADEWTAASEIPGPPVFGHAGTLVGDHIVYVDGVRTDGGDPRFVLDEAAWEGEIDPARPQLIAWTRIADHPPPPLYRAAAGAVGGLALFAGGSDNPYNYDGIGYDGRPSRPLRQVLAYAPGALEWRVLYAPPVASMDHRTLGVAGGFVFLVGGMEEGQRVTDRVWYASIQELLGAQP